MNFIRKTEHLKRYKDLTWLLMKYGRSDLVDNIGLNDLAESSELKKGKGDSKAEELPDDLEKLGPTYIKLGQFLSTRSDFLPADYLEALARLQDNVKPVPYKKVEELVMSELGVRISKAFSKFEPEPVASASLGQVHYATLRDGRAVAVKVQRPGIREQVISDLDAFEDIAEFLEKHTDAGKQFMLHATLEEFRKAMLRELDFRQEAQNLKRLGDNLKEFDAILVPEPIDDFTTSRILIMDYIRGTKVTKIGPLRRLELNGGELAEALFTAYLKQILIDGFYHADPHPGNIFLTDDNGLALLDLGMVGHISPKIQRNLLRVLIAISEGDGEQAAKYTIEIGEKLDDFNEKKFSQQISEFIAAHRNSTLEQMQVGRLVLEVTKISAHNGIRLPNELVMLAKTLLNLDQVGRTLDPEFDPDSAIRENAPNLLRKHLSRGTSFKGVYEALLDTKEIVEQLPGRVNKIFKALADNELKLNVNVIDERYFMTGLHEVANRITLGLILAAIIVGAALMMRVQTSFTIFGYPAIAIIFFLLAGVGGLILAFRILFKRGDTNSKT